MLAKQKHIIMVFIKKNIDNIKGDFYWKVCITTEGKI